VQLARRAEAELPEFAEAAREAAAAELPEYSLTSELVAAASAGCGTVRLSEVFGVRRDDGAVVDGEVIKLAAVRAARP
jgi:hypothetical protein